MPVPNPKFILSKFHEEQEYIECRDLDTLIAHNTSFTETKKKLDRILRASVD